MNQTNQYNYKNIFIFNEKRTDKTSADATIIELIKEKIKKFLEYGYFLV